MNEKTITLNEMEIRSIIFGLTISILDTLDLDDKKISWADKKEEMNYLRDLRKKLENA